MVLLALTASPASARIAVVGDWGYGGREQRAVFERVCAVAGLTTLLTTGDNFYRPDGVATEQNFYRPTACLRERGVVWRAAWGNHDLAGGDTAAVLGATRSWAADVGGLRVVALDADPARDDQRALLRRELSRGARFTLIISHTPVATAGLKAQPGVAAALEPLLRARSRGTVVLQGDNHIYERIERGGVTYLTSGGGGAPLTPCVRPTVGLRRCRPEHHFLTIDRGSDVLRVRAIDSAGRVFDRRAVLGRRARALPSLVGF